VSPQAISLSTRELEDLGLIVRSRDDEDRRRLWLTLTEAGGTRYEQENLATQAWLATAIEQRLTKAEMQTLAAGGTGAG
jgi:DNA-binding MarR family transcriptional regulator